MRFDKKVVIVTGAASGMGKFHAETFAEFGASVAMVDIQDAVTDVSAQVPGSIAVVADVAESGASAAVVDEVMQRHGRVDILINNAGGAIFSGRTPFWEVEEDQYDYLFRINLKSQWLFAKAVVPHMMQQGAGKIINISSNSAYGGAAGLLAYATFKSAVLAQTRQMAHELGPHNITVNSVSPGLVRVEHFKEAFTPAQFEAKAATLMERQAVKRVGEREDVTNAVMFLASDAGAFLSGQDIRVDGGLGTWSNLTTDRPATGTVMAKGQA